MDVLLKSARIIDPESAYHNKVRDILVSEGVIQILSDSIIPTGEMQVLENVCVSQGWADSSVCFGEPGFEERETLINGMRTAEKSGFTHLLINPLTYPIVDSQSGVVYIKNKTAHCAATAHPIGALTIESKGEYLSELFDMKNGGAVAFGGIVISFPNDTKIMGKGVVNEHVEATRLGLKGIPALAEELIVARDLAILEYTGGKLHIPTISTAKSAALIKEAKAKGLDVSCSVAIHNLHFTDEVLENFNTNYKVLPPLRDKTNVQSLREALNEGVIDFVTSDHNPLDIELKFKEFDWAAFGTIGLENAFGVLTQYTTIEQAIQLLTAARKRFAIPSSPIVEGTPADMTLFTLEDTSVFTVNDILSSSKNSAFIGEKMKGKVVGIIARNQLILN